MTDAKQGLIDAAAKHPEVTLETTGRVSGRPHRVTLWITTDGTHVYIRSGEGTQRDWPQNLLARGEATLIAGDRSFRVSARHVTNEETARSTSLLARKKYGSYVKPSKPGEPLTKGESAVFELRASS